jgi:hypothetical protein
MFVDPVNGVLLQSHDGNVRVDIPATGVLRVRDNEMLSRWHTLKARYANGTPIPYEPNGNGRPDEPILIDGSAGTNDGITVHWFYIGTRRDYNNQVGVAAVEDEFSKQVEQYRALQKR